MDKKPCCKKCKTTQGNIILRFEHRGKELFNYKKYKSKNGYCYDCFEEKYGVTISNKNHL